MTQDMLLDAIGMIDTDLLESYTQVETRLLLRKKRRMPVWGKLLIAAACLLLTFSLLLASLPLTYIVHREQINSAVVESIDRVLFPLDDEETDIKQEDLLLNWIEWEFSEELFAALGAGTEDSVIDQMQGMQGGLFGEIMQSIGAFLERLYEYYHKHKTDPEPPIEQDTEQTTDEPEEPTTQGEQTVYEHNGIVYERGEKDDYWQVTKIKTTSELSNGDGVVEILAEINGLPVQVIAEKAAYNNVFIKELILPDSITEIQAEAFYYSTQLHTVKWSQNLQHIGREAFYCNDIRELELPDSLQSMDEGVFLNSQRMNRAVLPKNLTTIPAKCFSDSVNLTEVIIGEGCIRILDHAFSGCIAIKTIELPAQLQDIGSAVFTGSGLESIVLPPSVTTIEPSAFSGCSELVSVTLPESLETVPSDCFYRCGKLKEIVLPTSCQTIGASAFNYCVSLQEIVIPDGVTTIESGAFGGCTGLKQVTFSENLKNIYEYAFSTCSSLEAVILPEGLEIIGQRAFLNCTNVKELYLPKSLLTVGLESFKGCTSLSSVSIPDGVDQMGERVFQDCVSLQSAYVPAFIEEFPDSFELFMGCYSLKNVTFGEGFDGRDLCIGMFTNTGFVRITLPDKVDTIESRVFQDCANLEEVYLPENFEHIVSDAFTGCANLKSIYYPGTVQEFESKVQVDTRAIPSGVKIVCTDGEIVIE